MRTFFKRYGKTLLKIIPGLLLILFSFFIFAYYPKINISKTQTVAKASPSNAKLVPYDFRSNPVYGMSKKLQSEQLTKKQIKLREQKARKKINYKSSVPYKVKINRTENFVMIYGVDIYGKYTIPYKCFVCSTAKNIKNTLLGHYRLNGRYRWHWMVDNSYAQYAIRFYNTLMLHSVPYYKQKPNTLETNEYNKLGSSASLGCVRMRVADIKWIYDHCQSGTELTIYDKKGEIPPIPYEEPAKLSTSDSKSCWDPTDPNKNNPWNK